MMVAAARREASRIGMDILKAGGNAVDAAAAVGLALGVCEPGASGLGGGGFITLLMAESKQPIFIDFRETAPSSASPDMWPRDDDGNILDRAQSVGGRSVCIPGEAAGMAHALNGYGTMSLDALTAPAIELARGGFTLTPALLRDLENHSDKLSAFAENSNPYLGRFTEGQLFRNHPLANTLENLAVRGAEDFYRGSTAERFANSINRHDGGVSPEDFEGYRVRERPPVQGSYRGFTVLSSPPPSSGGTHIVQILNILENFPLSRWAVNSAEYIHTIAEAVKTAFADRDEYMGDPDFIHVPVARLTAKEYANQLAREIHPNQARFPEHPGPFGRDSPDTTHYSIVDGEGNLASVTKTISSFFGSGLVPCETGVVLNCQMRGFSSAGTGRNRVGPRRRPLSSMSPTIILNGEKPFAVLGTPGGNRIIPVMVQVISKLIDHRLPLDQAVSGPRFANPKGNEIICEDRIDNQVLEHLSSMGHSVTRLGAFDRKLGGVQAIVIDGEGNLTGTADPRRDGAVIGV